MLLGAGAHGRVYKGFWHGCPVAVKIFHHSEAEEPLIDRELGLVMGVTHRNIVAALHYEKMRHWKEVSRLQGCSAWACDQTV